MPLFYPVAGQKFFIGGTIADKNTPYTAADFENITWTQVNGWNSMGALGSSASNIDVSLIDQEWDATMKGTRAPMEFTNRFVTQPSDPGQAALIAAEQSPEFYAFKIEGNDGALEASKSATISIASPGVITSNAHGYANGARIRFGTTGILPTGITAGTDYYVVNTATNTFGVAATPGGAAINTTGTQTGTHNVAAVKAPSQRLIAALVMGVTEPNGDANTAQFLEATLRRRMRPVRIAAAA